MARDLCCLTDPCHALLSLLSMPFLALPSRTLTLPRLSETISFSLSYVISGNQLANREHFGSKKFCARIHRHAQKWWKPLRVDARHSCNKNLFRCFIILTQNHSCLWRPQDVLASSELYRTAKPTCQVGFDPYPGSYIRQNPCFFIKCLSEARKVYSSS